MNRQKQAVRAPLVRLNVQDFLVTSIFFDIHVILYIDKNKN